MSFRNIGIIFKKELIDVLRDRRTLTFMVLLPILVIPGMMWVMNKVMDAGVKALREDTSIVAVIGGDQAPSMRRLFDGLENAGTNPNLLGDIGDPLLARGLMNMMSPQETADAMLAASALAEQFDAEELGSARFLSFVDYAAQTEDGRALFAGGTPSFLRDGARLRLLRAARELAEAEAEGEEPSVSLDAGVLADRQRVANLSDVDRTALDVELEQFRTLQREIVAGVESRTFHAVVVFHDGFGDQLQSDGTARYSMLFDESVEKSDVAQKKLTRFLDRLSTGLVRARVLGHQLDGTLLEPLDAQEVNLGRARSILAIFLPYVVMIMCFVGAIYPAIDLGAGEKERGTLETLLVTPAQRIELVTGKFLVITLAALVAAMLNIASLTASMKLGLLQGMPMSGLSFDPRAVIVSLVLMLPVSATLAAALLAVSIFAKSFKEAQSYSVPVQLSLFVPAFVSFIPGIELTEKLSLVPLVSVALALKEAWSGIFQWNCIAIIIVSSLVYAALALLFCAKWFQREEVLFRT